MKTQPFNIWLASYLNQKEEDVKKLLQNETAIHFLIAWSLLEAVCFNGFMKVNCIDKFADSKAEDNSGAFKSQVQRG